MIGVRELRKIFTTQESKVAAVNGIDFTVNQGRFFTLLGPSGCGKSTTLRCIAGLERPDAGEITIGKSIVFSSRMGIHVPTNRRAIGMVFQSYAIWPHMTVFGSVAYPLKIKGLSRAEIAARVDQVLHLVGLGGLGNRPAPLLSGGQQQRVALARAVVAEPAVLLLDEPLSNLDAQLRTHMREEIKKLQARLGMTTIYVTHDQQEALSMSDEIALISEGRIVQQGTPHEIYYYPRNCFTAKFIGSTNLIEVKTPGTAVRPGINKVETTLGSLLAYLHDGMPMLLTGESQFISVRPEVISMSEGNGDGERAGGPENTLDGRIEELFFIGDSIDYRVRVRENLFQVRTNSMQRLTLGTEVLLHLPPRFCVLVAKDGTVPAGLTTA
ncbi:MAG: ABC transporter ATP-binding protein [Firmicutes bacterium]|nr:ABC transporter ATP-binding protein [Bacillota bacterium]